MYRRRAIATIQKITEGYHYIHRKMQPNPTLRLPIHKRQMLQTNRKAHLKNKLEIIYEILGNFTRSLISYYKYLFRKLKLLNFRMIYRLLIDTTFLTLAPSIILQNFITDTLINTSSSKTIQRIYNLN